METVKFAIVGCGRVAQMHLAAIKAAPHAELCAVCDIDEKAARDAAKTGGLDRYYTDMEEMLEKEDIDVINVCVPSGYHADIAIRAAQHKKHVFSEKPLDVTRERMDAMIAACRENGVLFGGVFQRRNTDIVQTAKKLVADGKLGKICICDANLKYYRGQDYYDSAAWRGTKALDGGCLMNQGIHGVDMLMEVAGPIKSVMAHCRTLVRNIESEDTACVLVTFESGAIGVIEASTSVSPGQDTVFSVHGDRGSVIFGNGGFYSWQLPDGSEAPKMHDNLGGINCEWAGEELHARQIEDMAVAVRTGREPIITGESAKRAVCVVLAIYESERTGKEVVVEY